MNDVIELPRWYVVLAEFWLVVTFGINFWALYKIGYYAREFGELAKKAKFFALQHELLSAKVAGYEAVIEELRKHQ